MYQQYKGATGQEDQDLSFGRFFKKLGRGIKKTAGKASRGFQEAAPYILKGLSEYEKYKGATGQEDQDLSLGNFMKDAYKVYQFGEDNKELIGDAWSAGKSIYPYAKKGYQSMRNRFGETD